MGLNYKKAYTFKNLWQDILSAKDKPELTDTRRRVWGTDPMDRGEGLAFSYSGEQIFNPGKCEKDMNFRSANIERELAMMNKIIETTLKSYFSGESVNLGINTILNE